jgi:nucleoside-diphosphate-sugar epimerase
MSETILLTGGTGFIGSAILRAAIARGHKVVALTRSKQEPKENVEFVQGSLGDAPWDRIKDLQPTVCVDSAWISTPGAYLHSAENVRFLYESLAFLEKTEVPRALVLGTCIEYANTGQKMREDETPLAPVSLYARCKVAFRERIQEELPNVKLAWARIFYPYGPGEHRLRLSSSIVETISRGEEVLIKTPASQKDFVYVDDVANGILHILESGFAGAINVGTGVGTTVLDFAKRIGNLMDRGDLIKAASSPAAEPYDFVVADSERLRGLGWAPKVGLEEGLSRLVKSLAKKETNLSK